MFQPKAMCGIGENNSPKTNTNTAFCSLRRWYTARHLRSVFRGRVSLMITVLLCALAQNDSVANGWCIVHYGYFADCLWDVSTPDRDADNGRALNMLISNRVVLSFFQELFVSQEQLSKFSCKPCLLLITSIRIAHGKSKNESHLHACKSLFGSYVTSCRLQTNLAMWLFEQRLLDHLFLQRGLRKCVLGWVILFALRVWN